MAGVFKIGVVSRKTGLSAATLRLWEDQYGLLAPARTRGGTRLYSESDVERALYVRQLVRDRGYALAAIAAILDEANSKLPYALDRVAVENIYLRDATNHADLEEGRRMARVHATVRSLIRAESAERAAVTLVAGVKAITGANRSSLALYQRKNYALDFVVIAGSRGVGPPSRPSLPISRFPRAWQEAIDAREPYADQDLLRLDLPGEVQTLVVNEGARSFHAEPLTIANEMVGVLIIGSSRPGGIRPEAQRVCAELAAAAGPAIHYFAQQFESAPLSEPRL
jgi:MerR family transcriptional regulator/heat shock protein HspR